MEDNGKNYLSVLSNSNALKRVMTDEELLIFQSELWLLLGQRTERYTMGDSSSVPIEVAEELLKSISYCISMSEKSKSIGDNLFENKTIAVKQLFTLGLAEIEKQIKVGKELLSKATDGMLLIHNIFYQDTIIQIETFFKKYDYSFFAHENPCIIDYPLCHSLMDLQGIEYINQYLKCLIIENDFCRYFNMETIVALLQAHSIDYETQWFNIYELVANNVIGLAIIDSDVTTLNVSPTDCRQLAECLCGLSKKDAIQNLIYTTKKLCDSLGIVDLLAQAYLKNTAVALYGRIETLQHTNCINRLFICLDNIQKPKTPITEYFDSEMMDNDELRKLISEISDCRFVSDKIAIVKQQIHSLRDFLEVLNICFWDDECIALFESLDNVSVATLLHFFYQKSSADSSFESESGWETQLINYIENIDISKKIEIENMVSEMKNPPLI